MRHIPIMAQLMRITCRVYRLRKGHLFDSDTVYRTHRVKIPQTNHASRSDCAITKNKAQLQSISRMPTRSVYEQIIFGEKMNVIDLPENNHTIPDHIQKRDDVA